MLSLRPAAAAATAAASVARRAAPAAAALARWQSSSAPPPPAATAPSTKGAAKERPLCLSDREARKLIVRGKEVPVDAGYWEHVADEKSVRDAAEYRNNTENYVGTVKYPVGVIGPLRVNGEHSNKEYFVPMATHEGALLASYDRGAKAITESGGVTARIKGRCMLRAPVFIFKNIADATDFYRYADSPEVKKAVSEVLNTSLNHVTVTHLRVFQTDRKVHISIGIDSADAAGQNKVTYAGDIVMQYMQEKYPGTIPEMYIEGGFNSGKRISVIHSLLGKGHSIVADCIIPYDTVTRVLRTTPYRLQRFQKMHNRTNEFIGGISCTAHVANGLAAFFIATGNDPACVAESQAAVTHFDVEWADRQTDLTKGDLYASITLNSLIVAAIGGGTSLPAFKAARSMMGVESANEVAEVCAAVALAGELSFYAAMESGEFSHAHWSMTHKS